MRWLPTGTQMRCADDYTINHIGLPSMVLMERAALQVMAQLEKMDLTKILVVCGSGNNGGDGYAVARLLYLKGCDVELFFLGNDSSRSEENRRQKEIAEHYQIPVVTELTDKNYSVIVDAIFGTGLKRNIEGKYFNIIDKLNQFAGKKVAIDIPSGIHDTTGEVMGIGFCADITVAIAYTKRGLVFYPGAEYAGEIVEGDIGITPDCLSDGEILTYGYTFQDFKKDYPKRISNSHKGTFGKVLLIVGSTGMSGAAYLCAKSVYEVGAGLVQIYTTEDNRIILQKLLPEAIISTYSNYDKEKLQQLLSWADVVGIGCGIGQSETAVSIVKQTLETANIPCVVDADALNILAKHSEWLTCCRQDLILTPHIKEMSRLLQCSVDDIVADRISVLTKFVEHYRVACVLKDARTLVASNYKNLYVNLSGNSAMAKAGAGDVLTGVIAGIVAQGGDAYKAACLGVYLHGLAGDMARDKKGQYSVLASDIAEGVKEVLKQI